MSELNPRPPGTIRFCLILVLAFVGFWSLFFSIWVWEDFLGRVFLTCLMLIVALVISLAISFSLENSRGRP